MKNFSLIFVFLIFEFATGQSVLGKWKTIDDVTGEEKSVVQLYEENGKVYGKIIEIFDASKRNSLCTNCSGKLKDKPVLGMVFLFDLEKDDDSYEDGTIIDPKTGKEYSCYIELEDKNTLKVRGYIGISLVGRTQYWKRMSN